MKPHDVCRILDNPVKVATFLLERDIYQPADVERLLIYERSHKHRITMERALVKRMKEVVHIQCTVPAFLRTKW